MLLTNVQVTCLVDDNLVAEDLLIGEEPCSEDRIADWRVVEYSQDQLVGFHVVIWWLSVSICHG